MKSSSGNSLVGESEGATVGSFVGANVVGVPVVGFAVGAFVGDAVGVTIELSVGAVVTGATVASSSAGGVEVGDFVGAGVLSVGEGVSRNLGSIQ